MGVQEDQLHARDVHAPETRREPRALALLPDLVLSL
ncbi:hypothetical protein P3T27_004346 [Kitasatospora sp. MAA19]|nr:hypothetical protein [Kitasatospora sp. MAA19]